MKKTIHNVALALLAILLHACYSSPDLSQLSSDFVVATDVDLEVDFTDYATYYLSDTISIVTNDRRTEGDSILTPDTNPSSTAIINKIEENMTARGYARSDDPLDVINKAVDFAIGSTVVEISNTGQTCWGWWGGYPGYWPPWYWGYPGYGYYYPYCSYYQYDTGSLILEFGDIKNAANGRRVNAMWNTAIFGVLSDYTQTNMNRALKGIDQAFEQSPYIDNN